MNYEYTIISDKTSAPLRYVTGLQSDAHLNCKPGESVVPGRVERTASHSELLLTVRQLRDSILAYSDWTQVVDSPLSDTQKSAWATYRQTLRDIPADNANVTSIDDVTWPTPP